MDLKYSKTKSACTCDLDAFKILSVFRNNTSQMLLLLNTFYTIANWRLFKKLILPDEFSILLKEKILRKMWST